MGFRFRPLSASFQAKVLVPVVATMVLLVVVPATIVSYRLSQQLERGAAANLATADAVFNTLQAVRAKNLVLRYQGVPNEPRFQAAASPSSNPRTLEGVLKDLLDESGADAVLFARDPRQPVAQAAKPDWLRFESFAQLAAPAMERTSNESPNVEIVQAGRRLMDVVCIPARVGSYLEGVLVFGTELGPAVAQELKQLTHSEIVLVSGGRILLATLESPQLDAAVNSLLAPGPENAGRHNAFDHRAGAIEIEGDHFKYLTGRLGPPGSRTDQGYILLCSYEQPLSELQRTQRGFLWIRLGGILLATAVVSIFVRRVMRPLRHLRDSAEAVGRGDYSQRVAVESEDECGELAKVFNEMTASVESSRRQLEEAVKTLRATQAQLVQSEKMRAIGTLAGGIAHDFNNILGSILGFTELALEDAPAGGRTARQLGQVMKAGGRARDLVRQILTFSRHSEPQRVTLRLGAIVEETLKLLGAAQPPNIKMEVELATDNDWVAADSTQLHQVLMNLGTNACHAMREGGGTLRFVLRDHTVTSGVALAAASLKPGPYLRLEVSDTGHGMEPDVMARIFEPFFTTKPVGEGTGLGLSVVHGIIESHGGQIIVCSEPGHGTTFSLVLPRAAGKGAAAGVAAEPLRGNQERILVVDDEEGLVQVMHEKLTRLGYDVVSHSDSLTALKMFQAEPQSFDLVITDESMPRLTGIELARQIAHTRRDLPVIVCSGFDQAPANAQSECPAICEWVLKPLDFPSLSRSIRTHLAAPAGPPQKLP